MVKSRFDILWDFDQKNLHELRKDVAFSFVHLIPENTRRLHRHYQKFRLENISINQFQISQMLPIILHELDPILIESWKTFSEIIKFRFIGNSMIFYVIWLTFILLKRRDHFWVKISCFKFTFDLLVPIWWKFDCLGSCFKIMNKNFINIPQLLDGLS
jgi:hypothetical protein